MSFPRRMRRRPECSPTTVSSGLPKGGQATVLYGDPAKAGPFAIRLKAPAGYRVPRHWHPTDEHVTVIELPYRTGPDGVST